MRARLARPMNFQEWVITFGMVFLIPLSMARRVPVLHAPLGEAVQGLLVKLTFALPSPSLVAVTTIGPPLPALVRTIASARPL